VVQFAPMESKRIIDLPCTAGDLKAALRGVDDTVVVDIDSEFRRVCSTPGVSHVRVEMLVARDTE